MSEKITNAARKRVRKSKNEMAVFVEKRALFASEIDLAIAEKSKGKSINAQYMDVIKSEIQKGAEAGLSAAKISKVIQKVFGRKIGESSIRSYCRNVLGLDPKVSKNAKKDDSKSHVAKLTDTTSQREAAAQKEDLI